MPKLDRSHRNAQIIALRLQGHTYEDIGKLHGLTKNGVKEVVKKTRPELMGSRK